MQKTVRVGYVNAATYEEGGEGEYKRGCGYEYLQRISYVTGWHYEYVYGSFKECYDMLARGGIDLFGNVSYMVFRRCEYENAAKKVRQMQALFAAGSTADYPRSFSCGILNVPEEHGALDTLELLRQADALMYEEKKAHHAGYQEA